MNTDPTTPPVNGDATHQLLSRLLLNRAQVASVLDVPAETVDYLHRVRKLRAVRVGKFNRWRPRDVQAYVDTLENETDS